MRSQLAGILFLALSSTLISAQSPTPAYLNPSLAPRERAADLVSRMTLEEKVSQMGNGAAAIPRLNVPAYNYWNEALHGVARSGYATMFPQAIGMAATWDAPLFQQIGDVISTEARAKNNEALRNNNHDIYFGLTFWSPNINIFRDPRWGRGQETYGEDPYLTAALAVKFITGLQGNDPKFFKVIATPKHYAVHSGPESDRHKFNVDPSPHDLYDTYLPQFRSAIVDAKAYSIMCAYNRVNGDPACGSQHLLVDVLRKDWNFQGFVTSDCGAIDDFFKPNTHRTEPDAEHADRDALLAGTDTNCGSTYEKLGAAVKEGLIKESDIDVSLIRLLEARMRLGLFDPPANVPYAQIPFSAVHNPAHAALAERTAKESMVLLKNDGILPLKAGKYKSVAVIGPNAAALSSLEGNYNGIAHDPQMPFDALRSALPGAKVIYAMGSPFVDGAAVPVSRSMLRPDKDSKEEGLKAEYFVGPALSGTPAHSVINHEINFDWAGVSPLPQAPDKGFAVRWTGFIQAPQAGDYTFTLRAGPCRGCATSQSFVVRIDGQQVSASAPPPSTSGPATTRINGITGLPEDARPAVPGRFDVKFAEGEKHRIEIEFVRQSATQGSGIRLEWTPPPGALLPAALEAANGSDLIIAMLGLTPNLEGEEMPVKLPGFSGGDRTDIDLPAAQQTLLEKLTATGKPVVVVLLNGSALAVNFAQDKSNAILEAWYPGEAGAKAITETLTGVNNPSGRLPVTFYRSASDIPAFDDYSMKNRTYRYFTGPVLYGFGYGLSYSHFTYGKLTMAKNAISAGDTLTAEVEVKNDSHTAGEEVAELYLIPPAEGNGGLSAKVQLKGFQRVALKPSETRKLTFTLNPRDISQVDATGQRAVQAGAYRISVGGAQPNDPKAPTPSQTASFSIQGNQTLPR
jgi:beta-glucosidase